MKNCGSIDDARELAWCRVKQEYSDRLSRELNLRRISVGCSQSHILTWRNKWRTLWSTGVGNQPVVSAVLISLYWLSRSKRVSPPSLKAQLQRGNLLLKQGRLDEAESDYKKVVSKLEFNLRDPGSSSRWQCLPVPECCKLKYFNFSFKWSRFTY